MASGDRTLAVHQRVYGWLLVLYPPAFRRDWGPAMVQLFGDQLRHPHRPGRTVGARVWLRALDDLLTSVPRQRWEAFMEETSTLHRAALVAAALAVVTALGTGLAVLAAGIGPAVPLAILFVVVLLVYRRQLRPLLTRRDGWWYRLLLGGIGLSVGAYLVALAYWSSHDTTSTLFLLVGNAVGLLGIVLALAGAALGLARLTRRARHTEHHG
jgi:hypothetical protein